MPRKPNEQSEGYNDPFPSKLRELMKENKTTQAQLAGVMGLGSRQAVTGYTDGSVQPTAEKIRAVAEYYGVTCDELLGMPDKDTGLSANAAAQVKKWTDYGLRQLTEHGEEHVNLSVKNTFEKMLECKDFDMFLARLATVGAKADIAHKFLDVGIAAYIEHVDFALFSLAKEAEKLAVEMYGIEELRQRAEEVAGHENKEPKS